MSDSRVNIYSFFYEYFVDWCTRWIFTNCYYNTFSF